MNPKIKQLRWKSAAARRLLDLAGNPLSVDSAVDRVVSKLVFDIAGPPTDLRALGAKLGIKRIDVDDLPFSGELRRDKKGFVIVCARTLSPARKRFTIAHEMAHAIFEHAGGNCPRVGRELERLCDMLATEILMPRRVFSAAMDPKFSVKCIPDLANRFRTSLMSTAIRCTQLRLLTVLLIHGDRIKWECGRARTRKKLLKDTPIHDVVQRIRNGAESFDRYVFLHDRGWRTDMLELRPEGEALLLLEPFETGSTQRQ